MTTRTASCRCGQLRATATGEPVRVSVCHCLTCQKRTGSAFAIQARWPEAQVTIEGQSKSWSRTADSGLPVTYHFCPECGSTVHFMTQHMPGLVAIPIGAFADPGFLHPRFSVWEQRKHQWVEILGDEVEHSQ
jgi:hypothetical protein